MKNINVLLALAFALFFLSLPVLSAAEIYSWTDEDGKLHFSDTRPSGSIGSTVTEAIKTRSYTVPIFKVTAADDPGIVGTYIPIYSGREGVPRYELVREGPMPPKERRPILFVDNDKGDWQWRISTGYSLYYSNRVKEGTPADKVDQWRRKYEDVVLTLVREEIESSRKLYDHNYRYGLNSRSSGLPDWQKVAYRVSGHPDHTINGEYSPVDWSSKTPRYRSERDTCLVLYKRGSSWQWALGACGMLSYSSSREPEQTMPHQVTRWMKNAGMQIISFRVEQITP